MEVPRAHTFSAAPLFSNGRQEMTLDDDSDTESLAAFHNPRMAEALTRENWSSEQYLHFPTPAWPASE